jgi:fucose permease
VSMNIQGYAVEQRRRRSLMPVLHAAFSGGAVLGAAGGALAAWLGVGLQQVVVGAFLALVGGLLGVRHFVASQPPAPQGQASHRPARGITRTEVLIGVVCLGAALAEGSANDWLALLLVDVHGAPEAFGALTFTAFNVTMLTGRLAGGRAIDRFGRAAVVRAGGVLAVAGILLLTLVPSLGAALAGGLLWGLGIATVFPAAMSAAGDVPGRGDAAIGVVSTISYGAFLFGAPVIGLLAESFGLDRGLWLVVAFLGLMVALAGQLREPSRSAGGPTGEVEDPVRA